MTDVTLLITSGNGPAECHQAVAGILARLLEEAEAQGLEADTHSVPAKHGLKSALVLLHGGSARSFAASWVGTVQWRAQSRLRPGHKRANWFVGVFELPQIARPEPLDPRDIAFQSCRAGGPGGQHQNTTESAVRATHRPTGLSVVARDMRSQHRNKALAIARLEQLRAAQLSADEAERKAQANQLHKRLERGNPVRCFKGVRFEDRARR